MAKKNIKTISRDVLSDEVVKLYEKGFATSDVDKYLIDKYKLTIATIRQIIHIANDKIKARAKKEREILINTHVSRYENIYEEHIKKNIDDFSQLPVYARRHALADCYSVAMDCLLAKERVIGLHNKKFRVQMNNFYNSKEDAVKYNFNEQKFEDLLELKKLLLKMKNHNIKKQIIYDDIQADISNLTDNEKIIDIDYVEVNDVNANKIKETLKDKLIVEDQNKVVIENLKEKLFKEDIKSHDKNTLRFLQKLKNKK